MKKSRGKAAVILGVIVVLLLALSSWYSIEFNDRRLVDPMSFSAYRFQVEDLPMLASLVLFTLYMIYLAVVLIRGILAEKQRREATNTTRKISPWLGLLGFAGSFGFFGFWTYSLDKTIFPFVFFVFFGFFSFFYEGKMSNTFMDERFQENRDRAELKAHRVTVVILFLMLILLGRGALLGDLERTLIAVVILLSLTMALDVFLSGYLLYRYDQADQLDDGGEG